MLNIFKLLFDHADLEMTAKKSSAEMHNFLFAMIPSLQEHYWNGLSAH